MGKNVTVQTPALGGFLYTCFLKRAFMRKHRRMERLQLLLLRKVTGKCSLQTDGKTGVCETRKQFFVSTSC